MFALYRLEGTRSYRFVRTVTVGGILADYLWREGQSRSPGPEGRMEWEISGNDLRRLVMKRFSTPEEINERSRFKLIADVTYGRGDALLLEICHVWGFADPKWSPVLLRLCHSYEGERPHGPGTPLETFTTDIDCSGATGFVHEFLYLQWGHDGGTQKNWGRIGYTNGALLWPPHLGHLLGKIGFKPAT